LIDWLLANHRMIVRWGRWIVLACVAMLLGIAQLPHNAVDRVLGIVGLLVVGTVFVAWLALAVVSLAFPRSLETLRRRRGRG
jgi:hypothetical protein